jgi:hypothetical protein
LDADCLKSLRGRVAYVRMTNPGTADYFVDKLRLQASSFRGPPRLAAEAPVLFDQT